MRLGYNSDVTQGHKGVQQSTHYFHTSLTSHDQQHTREYFNYSLNGKTAIGSNYGQDTPIQNYGIFRP